jgi:hypothetical protein
MSLHPSRKAPLITEIDMLSMKVSDFKKESLPDKIDILDFSWQRVNARDVLVSGALSLRIVA